MSEDGFLYFAYGSNMSSVRLRERCPSARALGIAELRGYELRWHKCSTDGSGKCDIVDNTALDAAVFGVLYQIADAEKRSLDEAEGGYNDEEADVLHASTLAKARVYCARESRIDSTLKPYTWYCAWVIAGANEHGLPISYVDQLKDFAAREAICDPNKERHGREMSRIPQDRQSC